MNRKLRITFVLGGRGLSGGVRVVVIYGNKLIERGHDVTIAIQRWPIDWGPRVLARRMWQRFAYATRLSHDHIHDFKGRVVWGPADDLSQTVPDGDAVIATFWLTAGPVHRLPESAGRKYYFIQRYEADHFDPESVDATWRLDMQKIVIARHLRDLARDRFDDPNPIMIFNGVDHKQFHAVERAMKKPPTIGLLYSPAPFKGLDVAFQAIRMARRQKPELRLIAFGAVKPTKELPLPPKTTYYHQPPQGRIRDIYASCDVWLCASRSEGFHLPPLEAMACRCPVVSTRVGGPAECVQPGVSGHLVDLEDAPGLAKGMVDVVSKPDRWAEMSEAAYQRSLRFDWDIQAELFEAALRDPTNVRTAHQEELPSSVAATLPS